MTTAIPAVTSQDACPHPIEARTTRTDHGTYDYDYEVCIICGCERPAHGDDDGCRICDAALDGGPGHEWAPGRGTEDAGASADAFPLDAPTEQTGYEASAFARRAVEENW